MRKHALENFLTDFYDSVRQRELYRGLREEEIQSPKEIQDQSPFSKAIPKLKKEISKVYGRFTHQPNEKPIQDPKRRFGTNISEGFGYTHCFPEIWF
jgi:hypothetical protein